jgi:hypothetical protein
MATDTAGFNVTSLPSQTTPFSQPTGCGLSVYCPFMTYLEYSMSSASHLHPLSGNPCVAVETTSTATYALARVTNNAACYPDGYFDLFPNEASSLFAENMPSEGQSSTVAYPGNACISGWTTACTTTITDESSSYPQAWCCPEGGWTCASATGYGDPAAPQRLCQSLMSTATHGKQLSVFHFYQFRTLARNEIFLRYKLNRTILKNPPRNLPETHTERLLT